MSGQMRLKNRIKSNVIWLFLCCIFALPTSQSLATQEVETPEETLEYLRILLAEPALASDIYLYARRGCNWIEEAVWFGTGWQKHGEDLRYGGGISIKFQNTAGEVEWLSYLFTWNKSKRQIENVHRNEKSKLLLEC